MKDAFCYNESADKVHSKAVFPYCQCSGVIPAKAGIQSQLGIEGLASYPVSPVNPALREGNGRKRDFFTAHTITKGIAKRQSFPKSAIGIKRSE
jgi:hypothetical protein